MKNLTGSISVLTPTSRLLPFGLIAIVAMIDVASASADPPDPSVPINLSEIEVFIEKELKEPTQMDFEETPFEEVFDFLTDLHGIPIHLDRIALDKIGIDNSTSVTIRVNGVPLRSGLNLLLRTVKPTLTYIIRDDVLVITSQAVDETTPDIRIYNVLRLLDPQENADLVAKALAVALKAKLRKATGQELDAARRPKDGDIDTDNTQVSPPYEIAFYKKTLIVRGPESLQREVQKILQALDQENSAQDR